MESFIEIGPVVLVYWRGHTGRHRHTDRHKHTHTHIHRQTTWYFRTQTITVLSVNDITECKNGSILAICVMCKEKYWFKKMLYDILLSIQKDIFVKSIIVFFILSFLFLYISKRCNKSYNLFDVHLLTNNLQLKVLTNLNGYLKQ